MTFRRLDVLQAVFPTQPRSVSPTHPTTHPVWTRWAIPPEDGVQPCWPGTAGLLGFPAYTYTHTHTMHTHTTHAHPCTVGPWVPSKIGALPGQRLAIPNQQLPDEFRGQQVKADGGMR